MCTTVRVGLAALSGVLLFAAFPGVGCWPLGFVALIPYLLALDGRSAPLSLAANWGVTACAESRRRTHPVGALGAAGLGWVVGSVSGVLGYYWLPASIGRFLDWGIGPSTAVSIGIWGLQGGRWAVFGLLLTMLRRSERRHDLIWVLGAFVASELCYPMVFPYALSAILWTVPELLQAADWGGQAAVAIPLVAFNWSLARLVRARSVSELMRPSVVVGLFLPVVALAYGRLRIAAVDGQLERAGPLTVGLVQTAARKDGDEDTGGSAVGSIRQHLILSRKHLLEDQPSLVIWGETALGTAHNVSGTAFGRPYALVPRHGGQVLVGARMTKQDAGTRNHPVVTNSALLIGAGGDVVGRYDKQGLIPWIEWIPPWARRYWDKKSYVPGSARTAMPIGNHFAAVFICYEALDAEYVRRLAHGGDAGLLINISDDSWFGQSFEAVQHLALAHLRAVENRRYLLRAASGGQSAIIDPTGRILALAPAHQGATLSAEVHWMEESTLFQRWGQLPWAIVGGLMVGYWCCIRRRS